MKIQVICEHCNKIAELIPVGKETEVNISSINKAFITGVDWDNESKENWNTDFIADLCAAKSNEEIKQLPYNDLTRFIYAETSDFDLCFTCRGCREQLILNQFELS
jgi:hypothetical protein